MKKYYFILQIFIILSARGWSQNIGIGNSSPIYKLDVNGTFHTASNAYVDGLLGVGTTSPDYKLQVNNGPLAFFNTIDSKLWYFNYSTAGLFYLSESGQTRITFANGGNVGIGTTAPAQNLMWQEMPMLVVILPLVVTKV